jgi:hypothetical protein
VEVRLGEVFEGRPTRTQVPAFRVIPIP